MSAAITMSESVYRRLLELAQEPHESAAVLLAQLVGADSRAPRLIVTDIAEVPAGAYETREHNRLQVMSDGYMPALATAEATGSVAIWMHTHPTGGSSVAPSRRDLRVNEQLGALFGLRTGTDTYSWLVVGHDSGRLTFTGGLEQVDSNLPITRLTAVGSGLLRISSQDTADDVLPDMFDRNIRALGTEVQRVVTDLTIAVVGSGGTGSAVAEQLVRLGARRMVLIDPDNLSASNVTRVYGSTPADIGRPKVDILAEHLSAVAPELVIESVNGTINDEAIARKLLEADLVFGCTDDNAGRLRLSRLPYYFLVPVIDCGVQLESDHNDIINGIFGRVTVLHPGTACLVCRERIDVALAAAELRSAVEQRKLQAEHYAPALPGVEPALVPFTTMVASYAVSELLERLIRYGESVTPSELLLRVHDRAVGVNFQDPTPGHYCDPAIEITYDDDLFLGLNWTS